MRAEFEICGDRLNPNFPKERERVPHLARLDQILLFIGLLALWALTHRYFSLMFDGELYGFQALARIHPSLAADLYLANTSQDQFTFFSALYASVIRLCGLQTAGCIVFAACRIGYLAGAWLLASRFTSQLTAWLVVAALVCVASPYGAYGVFESASDYLTARTLAEALVVIALAASNNRLLAIALLGAAFAIHPLMALPGALLLICLSIPVGYAVVLFACGVLGVAGVALLVTHGIVESRFLVVMDSAWLEVVRERSQFLFPQYWRLNDWECQARPFLTIALTLTCISNSPLRKLCIAAAIVGAAGLLVAAIAGFIGPVALLLQGQTWRWMWLTGFTAVLVAVPTIQHLWRSPRCGRLCAVLVVAGWTFPPVNGSLCILGAMLLWHLNARLPSNQYVRMRQAAYVLMAVMGAWTVVSVLHPDLPRPEQVGAFVRLGDWLRGIFSVQLLALGVFAALVWAVGCARPERWVGGALSIVLIGVLSPTVLSGSGVQAIEDRALTSTWRSAIPEGANVLLLPLRKSAGFPWFTLERPGYLSLTQSAGVIFSAATAAEVRRRSDVLKPVADPDWRLLSIIAQAERHQPQPEPNRPLTAEALRELCVDEALGFVIAQETLEYEHLVNQVPGRWKGWSLYDCRRVRNIQKPL